MNKAKKLLDISELSYPGNMGVMEMMRFYSVASPAEVQEMESILDTNDWGKFKKLIFRVVGVKLY